MTVYLLEDLSPGIIGSPNCSKDGLRSPSLAAAPFRADSNRLLHSAALLGCPKKQ